MTRMTPKTGNHPHRAEAIQIVRDRHAAKGDPIDDMPDEAVAKLFETPHVEFRLACRQFYRAVWDGLPAWLRGSRKRP